MPRVPDVWLDSVVYLFSTEDDARKGRNQGGTGFFVGLPFVERRSSFIYLVTNRHVVHPKHGNCCYMRVNTKDGPPDVIKLERPWVYHPDGDDVAVAEIGLRDSYQCTFVSSDHFLDEGLVEREDIGPGDEVFFIGRFAVHGGSALNLPSVRFGNISMMPKEPLWNSYLCIKQDSYLVEARSLSGYSGSPVFVCKTALSDVLSTGNTHLGRTYVGLLGIDWGHLSGAYEPLLQEDKKTVASPPRYVKQNLGMMAVVPTWKIIDTLKLPELQEARKRANEHWCARNIPHDGSVDPDEASQ